MKRLFAGFLILAFVAGPARAAETGAERFARLYRERAATTRYGAPPHTTNTMSQSGGGDLVVAFAAYSSSSYGDSFGPITATLRFSVPYTTAQGWTGYVLEGQSEPADIGDVMSREWIICDPSTGGNLIMLFHYGTEHGNFDTLDPATTPTYTPFGSTSGTMALSREAPSSSVTAALRMPPEVVARFLRPPPSVAAPAAGGTVWADCIAIPEGVWATEVSNEWTVALCDRDSLRAVSWRHAVGIAPTNLPVTLAHDPSRVVGRVAGFWHEEGTGLVARLQLRADFAEAPRILRSWRLSPDITCFTTATNVPVRNDAWRHEHQAYFDSELVPRLLRERAAAAGNAARLARVQAELDRIGQITNAPAQISAIVMQPVYLRGVSLVERPLLPTQRVRRDLHASPASPRDAYPVDPRVAYPKTDTP